MSLSVTSMHLLNTSRGCDSTTSLGRLSQQLITLSVKKPFLIFKLNLPWHNLRPFPLLLSLVKLGEETNTWLTTTSFQIVVESNKVTPQPPLLQNKQPHLPQLLLVRLVLQTPHQPCCPLLNTLQHLLCLWAWKGLLVTCRRVKVQSSGHTGDNRDVPQGPKFLANCRKHPFGWGTERSHQLVCSDGFWRTDTSAPQMRQLNLTFAVRLSCHKA